MYIKFASEIHSVGDMRENKVSEEERGHCAKDRERLNIIVWTFHNLSFIAIIIILKIDLLGIVTGYLELLIAYLQ